MVNNLKLVIINEQYFKNKLFLFFLNKQPLINDFQ